MKNTERSTIENNSKIKMNWKRKKCACVAVVFALSFFIQDFHGIEVKAAVKPGTFKITSPNNNTEYKSPCDITVKYSSAKNVHHYRYSLSDITSGTGKSVIKTTNNKTNTSFKIPKAKLVSGHRYKIYASAYGNSNEDTAYKRAATCVEFSVKKAALSGETATTKLVKPGSFSITTPENNKVFDDLTDVVVKYSSAKDVHHYRYSLSDMTESINLIKTTHNKLNKSFTIPKDKLQYGHRYKIYVSAYGDTDENSKYKTAATCVEFEIKKKAVLPGEFSITSPTNNKTYSKPQDITVTYGKSKNVDHYRYSLTDVTGGVNAIKTTNNKLNTQFTIPKSKLKAKHQYKIYVSAYGDAKENTKYKRIATQKLFKIQASSNDEEVIISNISSGKASKVIIAGAHNDTDGCRGDSKGNETYANNYYSRPWKYAIRPTDKTVANRIVQACNYFIDNNKVNCGYSKALRSELYNAVLKCKGVLSNITSSYKDSKGKPILSADCSSFVCACVRYGLWNKERNISLTTTSYLYSELLATKYFTVVQSGTIDKSKLLAGDILLNPGVHTEIVTYAQ